MGDMVAVAREDEVPEGGKALFEVGDEKVLVVNVEGAYYGISSKCRHLGGPLARGTLDGTTIICPWHGSKYDVTTGELIEGPFNEDFRRAHPALAAAGILVPKRVKGSLTSYPVTVEGGMITIAVP